MGYDVIIAGGGPAGLAAALTLGRGRKRVLLCDAGPRRNAAALHVHNFVTRDGIPPSEFRRIGREQLTRYPNVETRESYVETITGERDAFTVKLSDGTVEARRIVLCTGMIDELPDIDGFHALWGKAIFACPYCHGWEVQDRRFGLLATDTEMLTFAIFLRGWTSDVVALTNRAITVPDEMRARLGAAGVPVDERRITRLVSSAGRLERVVFDVGGSLERDVLFAHPHQRQVDFVRALGPALDEKGFVRINDACETSIPGIYAAGDLLSPVQSAVLSAAAGMLAAASLNRALTVEHFT